MSAPALTAELAAFVAGITPQSIPSAALEVVRLGFADCCASLLAGLPEAATNTVAAMARANSGSQAPSVIRPQSWCSVPGSTAGSAAWSRVMLCSLNCHYNLLGFHGRLTGCRQD